MITGYYGKDGAMTEGFDTKDEAVEEFENYYQGDEFEGCYIAENNGKWVIAY